MRGSSWIRLFRLSRLCLPVLPLLLLPLGAAEAGIVGSAHDFKDKTLGDFGGPCEACHKVHGWVQTDPDLPFPAASLLWPRNLTEEDNYFDQDDTPDYVVDTTLLCYDCHDSQDATDVDEDPNPIIWGTSIHPGQNGEPQDIALDDWPGSQGSDKVGYYELFDGTLPAGGLNGGPTDGSDTAGHFWKSVPDITGLPYYEQGDKLACSICHDPHDTRTGTNEVMFLIETSDGMGSVISLNDGLQASDNTRQGVANPGVQTGRDMCAVCHSYSDSGGTGVPSDPVEMWNVVLPKPPINISQHESTKLMPCTDCHRHNRIVARCDECHGFPPLNTTAHDPTTNPNGESYAGGAGAHQRHLDALGASVFQCEICHGPDPGSATWHNEGNITPQLGDPQQGFVDIMGLQSLWDPGDTRSTSYTGAASGEVLPPGYEFVAKGGPDQRCAGLACHGEPTDNPGDLNWTDDMVDEATGAAIDLNVCIWCHDSSPATIDGGTVYAPNVMGDGVDFGADINGHGLPNIVRYDFASVGDAAGSFGAGRDCSVCHDATYTVGTGPDRTHFGAGVDARDETRLRDTINTEPVGAITGPDDACLACHQNGVVGDGADVSHHGNSNSGGYAPLEPDFTRQCRQCHEVHGQNWNGTGRNLYMVAKWIDADDDGAADPGEEARVDSDVGDHGGVNNYVYITAADNAVVFTNREGADSFDEGGEPVGSPDDDDDVCVTCHNFTLPVDGPSYTGGGDHGGTVNFNRDMRGSDCTLCHDHDFDDAALTADGFMPIGGCDACHGFPPTDPTPFDAATNPTGESYAGGAGAHLRHVDALASGVPEDLYCESCHGPIAGGATWHNEGSGTVLQANVDVMGIRADWDPGDTRTTGYVGVGSTEALDPAYEFVAKGGGDQRCFGLACHGEPPNSAGALNWTDDMVDEGTGSFTGADGRNICVWCHDQSIAIVSVLTSPGPPPAFSPPYYAPNIMGDGANFGFALSGHGLPAASNYDDGAVGDAGGLSGAEQDCDDCHDSTYVAGTGPTRTHFSDEAAVPPTDSRDWMRLRDTINGAAIGTSMTYPTGPDEACEACHKDGAGGGIDMPHHRNDDPASAYQTRLEAPFTRVCRQCHEVHGANWNGAGRNLHMIGKWTDDDTDGTPDGAEGARVDSNASDSTADITAADNAVVFTARTGANSHDEGGEGVGPPDDDDDICATCHIFPATAAGDHSGTAGFNSDERGTNCMQCHDHDYEDDPATDDAFMPSGCEGCHGDCDVVHPGRDGSLGTNDDAPHVMRNWYGIGDGCSTTASANGIQDGGHGDPDGVEGGNFSLTPGCVDCHNIGIPAGTHLDGTVNSIWNNDGTRNSNTAHLKPFFFGAGAGDWSDQVNFDDACWVTCHQGESLVDMRHERDGLPAATAVEFGQHLTFFAGDTVNNHGVDPNPPIDVSHGDTRNGTGAIDDPDYWPVESDPDWNLSGNRPPGYWAIDVDITTQAPAGQPNYATCATCHDPHGTGIIEASKNRNRMLRENWITPGDLCLACHR